MGPSPLGAAALGRKLASRPLPALARAVATAVVVGAVWGLARLSGMRLGGGGDVAGAYSAWGHPTKVAPGAPLGLTPTDLAAARGWGSAATAAAAAPALGDAAAAATAGGAPGGAADGGVRECKEAALHYLLTHLRDFHAESGAWALKTALLALRGALVGAGAAAAAGDDAGAGGWPSPPLVVDVGANRGQNVPVWRAIYGEAARLVLVEGNPATAAALRADVAKSDAVVVVERVVGNATQEMSFRVPKGGTTVERAAIQSESSVGLFPDEFDYVKLPVDTLDDILINPSLVPASWLEPSRRYPIDLLKIDTEGWDVTALQGAHAALQRTRFVLWECHLLMALVNGPRTTHVQAAALLASYGFESYKVSPQFVRFDGPYSMPELDERSNMGWQNCFALRADDPLRPELLGRFNHIFQCSGFPSGV